MCITCGLIEHQNSYHGSSASNRTGRVQQLPLKVLQLRNWYRASWGVANLCAKTVKANAATTCDNYKLIKEAPPRLKPKLCVYTTFRVEIATMRANMNRAPAWCQWQISKLTPLWQLRWKEVQCLRERLRKHQINPNHAYIYSELAMIQRNQRHQSSFSVLGNNHQARDHQQNAEPVSKQPALPNARTHTLWDI